MPIFLLLSMLLAVGTGCEENAVETHANRTEGSVSVLVVGDTMLDDMALPYIKKYGYEYLLEGVRDLLLGADVVSANLEVPIVKTCDRSQAAKYAYYMEPAGLRALKDAGINVVGLANNHILDCGEKGLTESLAHLEREGMYHYGGGFGKDRHRPLVIDVDGTRIGFVGWYKKRPGPDEYGPAQFTKKTVRKDLASVKRNADVVVATFHWGKNYTRPISGDQERFGKLAIDAGADVVIGHHPHIPQAMEVYKGKPVIYSVGNFSFTTGNDWAYEAFAARLIIQEKRIVRVEMVPLMVKNRDPKILWQTRQAWGRGAHRTLSRMAIESKKLGTELKITNDMAVLGL